VKHRAYEAWETIVLLTVNVDRHCLVIEHEELIEAVLAVEFGQAIVTFMVVAERILADPFCRHNHFIANISRRNIDEEIISLVAHEKSHCAILDDLSEYDYRRSLSFEDSVRYDNVH
jgi:hypothetical protein